MEKCTYIIIIIFTVNVINLFNLMLHFVYVEKTEKTKTNRLWVQFSRHQSRKIIVTHGYGAVSLFTSKE